VKKPFAVLILVLASLAYPLATASGSVPQEPTQHPIDKALDACIDKNGSTAGMVECTDKAYAAWDKELNKNYGELMRTVKPKQKEALRLSQLEWIKHRDLEFKSIDSIYDTLEGTMYIPMRISSHVEVIKKRALELKDRLDLARKAGKSEEGVGAWGRGKGVRFALCASPFPFSLPPLFLFPAPVRGRA
jgi:uncharacterized protein YecT (DUF1311 family)